LHKNNKNQTNGHPIYPTLTAIDDSSSEMQIFKTYH
jgi:hypothetical protein